VTTITLLPRSYLVKKFPEMLLFIRSYNLCLRAGGTSWQTSKNRVAIRSRYYHILWYDSTKAAASVKVTSGPSWRRRRCRGQHFQTFKGGNCDALQLEAAQRCDNRSGL